MQATAAFCGRCGAPQAELQTAVGAACPGCAVEGHTEAMRQWSLLPCDTRPDGFALSSCPRCGGVWVESVTLNAMLHAVARVEAMAPVKRRTMARGTLHAKVRYRRCVVCHQAMHRRNFARISGVVVDECRLHGTFFDAGELEDVVDFVQSGGLQLSDRQRVQEGAAPVVAANGWAGASVEDESFATAFVRWAWRWFERVS